MKPPRGWPLLLVAALALVASASRVWLPADVDELSAALLATGLISYGAWMAVEMMGTRHTPTEVPDPEVPDPEGDEHGS